MFFLFVQVALITLIHSLSSNLFLVPTLSFTRLFLLLSVCGTASIVPCVLRLLLFHLNGNLLIYAPMGVMSRISSTLLLTCIPCFHANIIKNKKNKNDDDDDDDEYDDTKIVKSRRSGFSRGKLEAGRKELGLCTARYESKSCC